MDKQTKARASENVRTNQEAASTHAVRPHAAVRRVKNGPEY
jgi:hypothetical protein